MKQVPPAHKSGTAGQVNYHTDAKPLTVQIDEYYTRRQAMNTTQRGKLAASIGKEPAATPAPAVGKET